MHEITLEWLNKIVDELVKENPEATIKDFIELKQELEQILNSN